MTQLSISEVYHVALQAGFSPHEAVTWTAIACAESGRRTTALASRGEYSVGLWQINLNAHKDVYGDLHNPLNNAKAAYEISGHGRNFDPWTTTHPSHQGTAADYRTYLPEVEREVGLAGDPRGSHGYGSRPLEPLTEEQYQSYFPTRPGVVDTASGAASDAASSVASAGGAHPATDVVASAAGTAAGPSHPDQDSDGDGLLDYFEQLLHTDPHRKDTDGDGLLDSYEVLVSHTDPTKADTDGDGRDDGQQVAAAVASGQTSAAADATAAGATGSGAGAGAAPKDTDGDGISDVDEQRLGTSPTNPDTDGDGVSDGTELALGTDPTRIDSDDDGVTDGRELGDHTNPLDSYRDAQGHSVTPSRWTPGSTPEAAASPGTGASAVSTSATGKRSALGVFLTDARAQKGDIYDYASTPDPDDENPKQFDCSSLVQWAAHRAGVDLPRTAETQYMKLKGEHHTISVDEALHTPGALLFYFSEEPHGALPAGDAHVCMSLGNGMTIEARGSAYGVGEWSATARTHHFNRAAIVPGLSDAASQQAFLAAAGGVGQDQAVALTAKGTKWDIPRVSGLTDASLLGSEDLKDDDGDGLTNAFEQIAGKDTSDRTAVTGTGSFAENSHSAKDSDHDGVSDHDELVLHTDPHNPDSDGDGLTDGQEVALGTDPNLKDSNSDGLTDGLEVRYHLDPLGPGFTDATEGLLPAGGDHAF